LRCQVGFCGGGFRQERRRGKFAHVPLKTSVIDDELAKLGLSFRATSGRRRKRVLAEAYAGKIAGYQFDVHAGIAADNAN
jgi:hypothetical protein